MEKTIIIASAILVFAIFFAVYFRKEIRTLFPRIQSIGGKGVSLSNSQSNSTSEKEITFEKQFDEHSRSPVQIEQEDLIRKELDTRGVKNETEQNKLLIRALASSVINANCERISLSIFGSQLEFLVELNATPKGFKIEEIKKWYADVVIPANPNLSNYDFEKYFNYLKDSNLVLLSEDTVKITQMGVEFMQYIVRTGKTYKRKN